MCDSFGHHTPYLSVHDYAMVLLGQQILLPRRSIKERPITTRRRESPFANIERGLKISPEILGL